MHKNSVAEILADLEGIVAVEGDDVKILDEAALPGKSAMLAYSAVFSEGLTKEIARWLIWETARELGIYPASIHELYMARGRGEVRFDFTVPAMNIRSINYYSSRAVFRAAKAHNAGAMLFEIARSEMGYTDQRPAEYVACVLAAAIAEGYRGPVFVQGDHFQVSAKNYAADPAAEVKNVTDLVQEAVSAGFYNIDIDTSTLVDLSKATLDEQQKLNYSECATITRFVRQVEPEGITVSLGGEIGEVGHKNSTVEELEAFIEGYNRELDGQCAGISKISVNTGTSHGGVVLPDGTLADVSVDFATLEELGRVAREKYGTGGAVQHGASTLPENAFSKFPEVKTLEIHLATNFMNMVFDRLPQEMLDEAYAYVRENHSNEWKEGKTEEQFLYSSRKRAVGAFKKEWWHMPQAKLDEIGADLEEKFSFLFDQLNIRDTYDIAKDVTTCIPLKRPRPQAAVEQEELKLASDLHD